MSEEQTVYCILLALDGLFSMRASNGIFCLSQDIRGYISEKDQGLLTIEGLSAE